MSTETILVLFLLSMVINFLLYSYMVFRNRKVYEYRISILHRNFEEYNNLPSYEKMFNKFWVWPLSKFNKYEN